MGKEIFTNDKYINDLFLKDVNIVTQARERVATAVNIAEVYTKFHIGQYIVEYEQKGETRAEYGKMCIRDRIYTSWHLISINIGQYIVEYEQKGETRAEYGKAVLKELSKRLTDRLGDGLSLIHIYDQLCERSDCMFN